MSVEDNEQWERMSLLFFDPCRLSPVLILRFSSQRRGEGSIFFLIDLHRELGRSDHLFFSWRAHLKLTHHPHEKNVQKEKCL